jgi:hypothetical protein
VADANGRPQGIPVPAHWPTPNLQATAVAIENLRNSVPLLRRGPKLRCT